MKSNKLNISDNTFIIPLRIDTISRLENTLVIINFLLKHFDSRIYVLEASNRNTKILQKLLPKEVIYCFKEDHDRIFHRTKYVNELTRLCDTPYISLWDTDIIIPPNQVAEAFTLLRTGKVHFVSPYEYKFLDTSFILRDLYIKSGDLKVLAKNQGKMKELYKPTPVGGVFFANREIYINSGMENEAFYGWGREDAERVYRWKTLGYVHMHIQGVLFHLTHERGINSHFHSPRQDDIKFSELLRVHAMSKNELENEVKKWGKVSEMAKQCRLVKTKEVYSSYYKAF